MSPTIVKNNISATGTAELTVTTTMLQAASTGIADNKLLFTIDSLPSQGGLKLNGTALALKGTFTQADINAGKLTYLPSGTTATMDGFGFTVTDGTTTTATSGSTQRVSISSSGTQGDNISGTDFISTINLLKNSISADGRYVAYESLASNLAAGDASGKYDIFVYDRQTGSNQRVSVSSSGSEGNGDSIHPAISADGRYVTFQSQSSNLVTGDTNTNGAQTNVFVRDLQTGTTELVSVTSSGVQTTGTNPVISADGRYIAFYAGNLFIRDRQTGTTKLVSADNSGNLPNDVAGADSLASISADGRYVAFDARASNLVAGDTNGYRDVFVRDVQTGTTQRVSVDNSGNQLDRASNNPVITADGKSVAFYALSTNTAQTTIFVRDLVAGTTTAVASGALLQQGAGLATSADGRFIAYLDGSSGSFALKLYDRQSKVTDEVANAPYSSAPSLAGFSISANGQFVAFSSGSPLVASDTNNFADVFVRDRGSSGGAVASISATAAITIAPKVVPQPNNAPIVANPIATQSIISGSALNFIFAANTFTDPDSGDVLSYSAKLANGNNLPTWLTFDAVTRTFAGTPAAGDVGNLSIAVTATDKAGLAVASNFGLNVTAAVVPPVNNPTTVNFTAPTKFAVGTGPNSLTSGDFNGDGILDLVTANGSNSVSVLLGNGKGSFGTATNFAAGNAPKSITARDFNGDGILDLVTANLLSNNVSVLLGDGKGSFGTPTQFDVGYFPSFVTVGDFNGDRILDLVTSDPYNNNLSVLLGDGKGSFGTPAKFAVLNHPNSVAVGDFNADGISDLATTNYTLGKSNVSVLLGNGKGGFGAPTSFDVGVHPDVDGNPILLKVGDFNGDGISDLATANYGSIDVSVLLGNGKGGFGTATNFAVGGSPTSITVGDFNNDGISDLATTNAAYSISILLGNGKGSFATATNLTGYYTPTSATVGDFNGDGISDLAIADSDGNNVSILLNKNVATPVNNAPVVANPISTQSIISGSLLKFVFAANTFTDPDSGDVLSYSAKLANGNNLPTWLTFDAVTRTFAGTPAAGDAGNLSIAVTATDKAGLKVATNFSLTIAAAIVTPVNNAPVVANPIATQSIVSGSALNFIFAANTFTDPDSGDVLSYSAKLANGNNLPTWLTFNAVTRTFVGTPAAGDVGNLSIAVTATDKAGLTVASNFGLNITGAVLPSVSPISGITVTKNLFQTDATAKGFGISALTQKSTNKVNEIGLFAVDDLTGKIGSFAPGSAGYLKAVLDIAQPIFATLAGTFLNQSKQEFSIDPNKIYQFFEIQDGSIVDLKQQLANGKTPTNILYSLPGANGISPIQVTTNSNNNGYKISVNADELILDVVKLAGSSVNAPIGTKSQTASEGRTIDFTDYPGKTLKVDITTKSDAAYDDNIGFYTVEDAIGSIKLANGSILKPGDANYAVEAIKNALANPQLLAGKTDSKLDRLITGGKIYAPVVVAQGTLNDFVSKNATNGGDGTAIHAYFNYLGANPDKLDHFRLVGNNTFGVEDLYGGGDRDFNDLVVSFNVKSVA